jgi:mannose-6-phosphate isomerase class I
MYILKPIPHSTLWGGDKLKKYIGNYNEKLGHLYLVNGHNGMSNTVINGIDSGRTLYETFKIRKNEWGLSEYEEFPLTIALVDASDNLSIQVHPDDVIAQKLEGHKIGKTESWLFMEAPVSGWIYDGCCLDTKEQVVNAVNEGKMEEITQRLRIIKGDYVCVEAGTLHAMTAGSLVYEIEYGSDFTYRFYDYNRCDEFGNTRELHVEKAVHAIDPNIKSKVTNVCNKEWIQEEHYEIRLVSDMENYRNVGKEIECISILNGEGKCQSILLLPNEELKGINIKKAVIARIRR